MSLRTAIFMARTVRSAAGVARVRGLQERRRPCYAPGMTSDPAAVQAYLAKLPDDRREAIGAVLKVMRRNMPKGYVETMSGGMICWQVPLEVYSDTCNKQPLLYA